MSPLLAATLDQRDWWLSQAVEAWAAGAWTAAERYCRRAWDADRRARELTT